jgi:hypothetical protein
VYGNGATVRVVPIRKLHSEDQKFRIDDKGRANQVTIDGVASGTPACFDLDHDSESVVYGVDLPRQDLDAVLAKQYGTPDPIPPVLRCLYVIPKGS